MQSVGPYQIVRELGRGGMGVVYEAQHPELPGRRLALKLNLSDEPETNVRFLREAELLARVQHPNVVRVIALDHTPRGPYLVTDLVEGEELSSHGGRPVEPREAARLVRELAGAVKAVHAQGILHRDLKPDNVIVRADGSPVLLDFGVAREVGGERLTQTGAAVGTLQYMSPEQAGGEPTSQLTPRTDVYALGAILFFLLTGDPPFRGAAISVITKVLTQDPPWPSRATAPPDLLAILQQAMAKERINRYPSAAALQADLDRFLAGEPVAAAPPRSRRGARALAGVVLLGLLGAGLFAARGDDPNPLPSITPSAGTTPAPNSAAPPPSAPATGIVPLVHLIEKTPTKLGRRVDACFSDNGTALTWSARPRADKRRGDRPGLGWVQRWSLTPTPQVVQRWQIPGGDRFVDALVVAPNGDPIVAVDRRLYRLGPESAVTPLGEPFPARIHALACSPQGTLAVGLWTKGQAVWTLDLVPGEARRLEIPGGGLLYRLAALCYRGDGVLLAGTRPSRSRTGTAGGLVVFSDPVVQRTEAADVHVLTSTGDPGTFILGTAAPQVIVVGPGSRRTVLERPRASTGSALRIDSLKSSPCAVAATRDLVFAIGVATDKPELRVWKRSGTRYEHQAAVEGWPSNPTSVAVSPNGLRLLIGSYVYGRSAPPVELWPVALLQGERQRSHYKKRGLR